MTTLATLGLAAAAPGAFAQGFTPGDLVVSRSVYQDVGAVAGLKVGDTLPGGGTATSDGSYPTVFNNNKVDGSFGVASAIFLDQFAVAGPVGTRVSTLAVDPTRIVTSFSSKSELALNLSTDGTALTFMGYAAPLGALDVSNSNTPGVIEPGNPVTTAPTYRAVAQFSANGSLAVTTSNAYAGNNGRAAILNSAASQYLTVGNAGNGSGGTGITGGTGVQIITPGTATPSTPLVKAGSFNVTQVGLPADKTAKDDNYRGETIFNNTLFVSKGSGGNGIDTVYQVGPTGTLPTGPGNAINILPGFPMVSAKTNTANFYPFGLFFANAGTLYVADEGTGNNSTTDNPTTDPNSGLEKWVNSKADGTGTWSRAYTLQSGLGLGVTYTPTGYAGPAPATDGLRNITGRVNGDGTVTIYGVTSTVSASGDQGADPNKLVAITDVVGNTDTTVAGLEQFTTLATANSGEVLRGVAFAPTPEPSGLVAMVLGMGVLGLMAARRVAKPA